MSLLCQLRPAPSERIDRRQGTRKYQPDLNLSRYVTIPTAEEARDPKPPPFQLKAEGSAPHQLYTTPYGVLTPELKDQFSRHYQWKTNSQLAYRPNMPRPLPPPDKGRETFEPRPDMVRQTWMGQRETGGPFEYQKVVARRGQMPEAKVWPRVEHVPFPHNSFHPEKLFRKIRPNYKGRQPEDEESVKNHIRQLVRNDQLNPQYVKPVTHYTGLQDHVRVYEDVDRSPGRNPVNMHSEYMAQYDRRFPSTEYRLPRYGQNHPLSSAVVLPHPHNHFNKKEYPNYLDYLPVPQNLTDKPYDLRLI